MDGRVMCSGINGSPQSTANSETAKRFWLWVWLI